MSFPKTATLANTPVKILGPYVSVKGGKWHVSHTDVIAEIEGVPFLAPIDELSDVEITEEEKNELEKATAAVFPDVVRLARLISG
jgi:hypothetical protein